MEGDILYPNGTPAILTRRELDSGWALFCQAHAASDLSIRVEEIGTGGDIQVRMLPCRVAAKEQLAHDVMRVKLSLPASERLQYLAGQYLDIVLRDGRRRAFSLANPPHDDAHLELHIRRVPGGEFSEHVFEKLREKSLLRIRGPLGSFYLRDEPALPVIFLAGGTGFAPIKSIIEEALSQGVSRPMHLYWGVRARRDLYLDTPRQWAERHDNVHYVPVLSEPEPEDNWDGRTGFVHEAVLADFPDLAGHQVYASGPPVMVNAARENFFERGLLPEYLYSDAFEFAYETGHDG